MGRAEESQIIDENITWKASRNNSRYAISKYGAEREIWRAMEEGLNAVIVNPSIILGPGEINSGSTKMIKTVENGLKFYTPGINGFVDVRDVTKIMIKLMELNISNERFVVSAENLNYKTLFSYIAKYLEKPAPKYEAKRWMGEIVWRMEYLRSQILGNKPLITKETARTAGNFYKYSNVKSKQLLNINYIPIEQSVKDACSFYKNELS
jgi:nucleoside-diphosphate-sugar epimerase